MLFRSYDNIEEISNVVVPLNPSKPSQGPDIAQTAGLFVGVCSEQGRRPYQEDDYAIRLFLSSKSSNHPMNHIETHFFGLYDGHAGGRCSKFVSTSLPDIFAEDSAYHTSIPTAIKRAYHTTNDQFLKIAEKLKLHDGSTGITSILRDNKLTVANVGDCRAVLISSGSKVTQLSIDQKPTQIEEQKRINQLGGVVLNCMGVARVNGVLAVSRAFGNRMIKSIIRPDAEITIRELQRDDEYLVMASDGLWDVLRNKDVCDIVSMYSIVNGSTMIAEELVRQALSKGSMDNVTCIVVSLNEYIKRNMNDRNNVMNTHSLSNKSKAYDINNSNTNESNIYYEEKIIDIVDDHMRSNSADSEGYEVFSHMNVKSAWNHNNSMSDGSGSGGSNAVVTNNSYNNSNIIINNRNMNNVNMLQNSNTNNNTNSNINNNSNNSNFNNSKVNNGRGNNNNNLLPPTGNSLRYRSSDNDTNNTNNSSTNNTISNINNSNTNNSNTNNSNTNNVNVYSNNISSNHISLQNLVQNNMLSNQYITNNHSNSNDMVISSNNVNNFLSSNPLSNIVVSTLPKRPSSVGPGLRASSRSSTAATNIPLHTTLNAFSSATSGSINMIRSLLSGQDHQSNIYSSSEVVRSAPSSVHGVRPTTSHHSNPSTYHDSSNRLSLGSSNVPIGSHTGHGSAGSSNIGFYTTNGPVLSSTGTLLRRSTPQRLPY